MKNIFIPYYINDETLRNAYKIAINRFENIDISSTSEETTIQTTVPLSELSCGKILQGSATLTIFKSNHKKSIDERETSLINIFANLENILYKNNAIKILTSDADLTSIIPGDIIEMQCSIEKSDNTLELLRNTLELMEFQQLTSQVDNTLLINWINRNIKILKEDKILKYPILPSFSSDSIAIASINSKYSYLDIEYYIGRPCTIVGQVTNYEKALDSSDIINSSPLISNMLWDFINSNEKCKSFIPHLKFDNKFTTDKKILDIFPIIIYM